MEDRFRDHGAFNAFFVVATEFSVHGWLLASKQLPPHGWFFPIHFKDALFLGCFHGWASLVFKVAESVINAKQTF